MLAAVALRPTHGYSERCLMANIVDERAYYYEQTGLVPIALGLAPLVPDVMTVKGTVAMRSVGRVGYYSGSEADIIDVLGITDPVLARLPCRRDNWGPGHYERIVPAGYESERERRRRQ